MADLGGWDGAILFSGRALSDLAVALDQSVQPTVDESQPNITYGSLSINLTEQLLNTELLVPHVLFATQNPAFNPNLPVYAGADDDLERLHARLKEYVRLGIFDPGNRLTFVRDEWFDGTNVLPEIELVEPHFVRLTVRGHVEIGNNFVDGATAASSPNTFEMVLQYRVQARNPHHFPLDLLEQLNVELGGLPFATLPTPCPPLADLRIPPLAGQPVWARRVRDPETNERVPRTNGEGFRWRLPTQDEVNQGRARLFTGAPGDCIIDSSVPEDDLFFERWVVVDAFREPDDNPDDNVPSADGLCSLPRRLLIDATCNGMAAEASREFASLAFDSVSDISIVGVPLLGVAERAAINRSIMKVDGWVMGAWMDGLLERMCRVNPNGDEDCPPPPNPQQLAVLGLLGAQAMNVAPLPAQLNLPIEPRYVQDPDGDYVQSDVLIFQDAATRVFPPADGDSGAIGLGANLSDVEPPVAALPENFTRGRNAPSEGQDLGIGLSQRVVDRWLRAQIEPEIRENLDENLDGFDNDAFRLSLTLADNQIDVMVRGGGALDLGLFDLPYDFQVTFPVRFRVQPAVARLADPDSDLNGQPVDAYGFALVEDLSCIGIDPANGDFWATDWDNNPLCFLGYRDPRVPGANLAGQPAGPWVRVTGEGCPSCTVPSPLCPEAPTVPPATRWREPEFPVPPFPCPFDACINSLRPGLEMAFLPPSRDEVDVEVDFPWWVDLLVGLLAGPLIGLDPVHTILTTWSLADLLATRLVYGDLRAGVVSQTPLQPSLTQSWQLFLQHSDPTLPTNDAVTIDDGAMCLLFRALIGPDTSLGSWAASVWPDSDS